MKKLFFFILFLTSCLNNTHDNNHVLKISLSSDIPSLDPAVAYDQVSNEILAQVYESLYQFHYFLRPYNLEPLIAETLPQYSSDKKTLTLKIKKNISYHPHPDLNKDRKVVAQDFINAFKRLAFIPIASPGFWLVDGIIQGINQWRSKVGSNIDLMINTPIEGLQAVDDNTLVIKLTQPSSQLIYAMAMPFTAPFPSELMKKYFIDPVTFPDFGTGAFFIKQFVQSNLVVISKFDHYQSSTFPSEGISPTPVGHKLPLLDEIHFSIIKESNSRWLKFLANETHLENVPKDYFPKVFDENLNLKNEFSKKPWKSFLVPSMTLWWVAFNMNDPLLGKNKNLRLAVAHAIDTEKYRKVFTANLALPMNSIIPNLIPGYIPFSKTFNYDPTLAKNYLKKSNLDLKKVKLKFTVRSNDSVGRQMAEFFQLQLHEIGLNLTIDPMPFQAFLEAQKKGNMQIFVDGWALDYPHPANMVQLLSNKNFAPGPNHTYYSNPIVEKIYETLLTPVEEEQKLQSMIGQIQEQLLNDLPWIPLMISRSAVVVNNRLINYNPSPVIANTLKYLDLEP